MKITSDTKVAEVLPLLNEERFSLIVDAVEPYLLPKPLTAMTCAEFIEALDEKYAMRFLERSERVVVAFGRYKEFLKQMQDITTYLKQYEVEQDADEKAAAQGVKFPSMQERILLDCIRFYHLHSPDEAERLPVAAWLLCVKSEGTAAQYQRKLSKIRQNKPAWKTLKSK